jgi:DNA-binding GntR family transcriptional regulator
LTDLAYLHHSRATYCVRVIVDDDSPEYPYVQLAGWLREGIASGRMGPRLPSITQLAEQTGLSAATVKRAFRVLADEGMIHAVRGRGTFVTSR